LYSILINVYIPTAKQLLKAQRLEKRPLALFRRFSKAFTGLWNFQNGPRSFWQFKTVLGSLTQL